MNKDSKDMNMIIESVKETAVKQPHRFNSDNQPEGRGRPKGSLSKFTPAALLRSIEETVGKPFVQSLAEGYKDSIDRGDHKTRYLYEKAILDKVVADKVSVEVDDGATMESKMQAFAQALNGFTLKPAMDTIPLATIDHDRGTVTYNTEDIHNNHDSHNAHQTHQNERGDDDNI
jgi:small nuclear ribonucleoprotein (snRNP)-like protein